MTLPKNIPWKKVITRYVITVVSIIAFFGLIFLTNDFEDIPENDITLILLDNIIEVILFLAFVFGIVYKAHDESLWKGNDYIGNDRN